VVLRKILISSMLFVKQLQIYTEAKGNTNPAIRTYISELSHGEIDLALLDRKAGEVFFVTEPVNEAGEIPKKLIDSMDYQYKAPVQLDIEDERLRSGLPSYERILLNYSPSLIGLRYKTLEAYRYNSSQNRDEHGGIARIYTLTGPVNDRVEDTKMDRSTYRLVIRDIVNEYRLRLNNGDIDRNYLPILPAPPHGMGENEEIHRITFDNLPLSDENYCDERFGWFICSPYTVEKLIAYRDNGNTSENSLDFYELMKNDEYKSRCEQAIEFIKKACNTDGKNFHGCDQEIDKMIISIWNVYAALLQNILL